MAIKICGRANAGEMSGEEFKAWLKRFDADGDGRISREELRRALRGIGKHFTGWKSGRAMHHADVNGNGYIDADEIENLVRYAQSKWGI